MLFGKKSKRSQMLEEQDRKFEQFKKEIQDEPLEKNDYLAMVLGALWALWPVLAIVIGIIVLISFVFM